MKGYVQVYRNLHKDHKAAWDGFPVYSVRGDDGLVKRHTSHLVIHDCVFRVGKKGNQRVRDEKRKNVHAFIRGYLWDGKISEDIANSNIWDNVSYNPYKSNTFVDNSNNPVYTAAYVDLDNEVIALEPR